MTIDVYDDRIRFLGYDVPFDTSKLPATAADSLIRKLQESVDLVDAGADQDEIEAAAEEAAEEERERIIKLIQEQIDKPADPTRFDDLATGAAKECAKLVADNMASLTNAQDIVVTLTRWFESELKTWLTAAAEQAMEGDNERLSDFLAQLEAA